MKKLLILLSLLTVITCGASKTDTPKYTFSIATIPDSVEKQMLLYSWREECPIPIEELLYLNLSYWDYDGKVQIGEMVVHKALAMETIEIFEILFNNKFPIEKMNLIEVYKGSDDTSMEDNNSSAFNCRSVPNKTTFSKHSYGVAIDLNPKINPYITKDGVFPEEGKKYTDRSKNYKGSINKGDIVVEAFVSRGWTWGGNWNSVKDYQHFQKPLKK